MYEIHLKFLLCVTTFINSIICCHIVQKNVNMLHQRPLSASVELYATIILTKLRGNLPYYENQKIF